MVYLDISANDRIRMVHPYEEVYEMNIPEVSYFGGDGKILHTEIEQNNVKKFMYDYICNLTCISKKTEREAERCFS
eukprot:snap_masked-scaffold_23-processed-gene-0.20-mRNA-1 protein AED:1.00 eAED:1.00 QI:0/-1/0/0/-1/1/1/0/75